MIKLYKKLLTLVQVPLDQSLGKSAVSSYPELYKLKLKNYFKNSVVIMQTRALFL